MVRFHASLSQASQVAYDPKNCPDLKAADVKTVQKPSTRSVSANRTADVAALSSDPMANSHR